MECDAGCALTKQILGVQNFELEHHLKNWVHEMHEKQVYLCDVLIHEKAHTKYVSI